MQKVRFIYNPKSGETVISEWLDHIIEIYQGHGYTVVPYRLCFGDTEETDMFDGVDQSYHHALIAGGDGTVNYVVNVMKRRGLDVYRRFAENADDPEKHVRETGLLFRRAGRTAEFP